MDYKKASEDYYDYVKAHLKFKEYILGLLFLLTILMFVVVISFSSAERLYPAKDYLILISFYIATILIIFEVCKGPKHKIINNAITNRKNDLCLVGCEKEIKELERLVNRI